MTEKKNILSYFIIVIYILLNATMIFGRIYYYNPSSQYDISKACIIIGIPLLLVIIFLLSGTIIKSIRARNTIICTYEVKKKKFPEIIPVLFLFIAGIAVRIYYTYYCPGSYITDNIKAHSQNPDNLYSYMINLLAYITGDSNYSGIYLNLILSIILMILLYMFARKATGFAGGCIVLFLTAVSPYEIVRCLMYSPDILYTVFTFAILTIFAYGYSRCKLSDIKNIKFTLVIVLIAILCGLFLIISPIAIPVIISVFLFTRFKVKDILQSLLFLIITATLYLGLIHMDKYIIPVDFIHNIHGTAEAFMYTCTDELIKFNPWKYFTLLCTDELMYNNYILDNYISDCIWMFLNIMSITGAVIMFRRKRSYNQLLMQNIIFTIPLCLLLHNYPESTAIYYVIYSMFVCMAGYTLYNIYCTCSETKTDEAVIIDDTPENDGLAAPEPAIDIQIDNIAEGTDMLVEDNIPEPLRISDILPDLSATSENVTSDTEDSSYNNNDIYSLLPVPRPVTPYGMPESGITVRDFQGNKETDSTTAKQWELRKMRTIKKNETR